MENDVNQQQQEVAARQAVVSAEQNYGLDDPQVAIRLNELAGLMGQDRQGEVEQLLRRALRIEEQYYGPDHPGLAVRLHNLACCLFFADQEKESFALFRRAIKLCDRSYGDSDARVLNILYNFAQFLESKGHSAEAEEFARRLVDLLFKVSVKEGRAHERLQGGLLIYDELLKKRLSPEKARAELNKVAQQNGCSIGPG
jgi:tetratricopeptide (TPR) repeat protein